MSPFASGITTNGFSDQHNPMKSMDRKLSVKVFFLHEQCFVEASPYLVTWRIYIVKFWCAVTSGPIFFIFMQFLAKFGQIIGWRLPIGCATPHLGNQDPVLQYSRNFTDKVAFMSCTLPRLSCPWTALLAFIALSDAQSSAQTRIHSAILVIDTSNNASYNQVHWLVRTPYLSIKASNAGAGLCEIGGEGVCMYQFQGLDSGNMEANDYLNRVSHLLIGREIKHWMHSL